MIERGLILIIWIAFMYLLYSMIFKPDSLKTDPAKGVEIITIDSCQYLNYGGAYGGLCHKGNCNNPIHKTR